MVKTTDKLHLDRFTPYRISVLANTIANTIAVVYKRTFSLAIPEWRIVAVLARFPDLSANQVCERTAMDKVAVSRAVRNLLRARRLVRTVAKSDRRRSVLNLSPAGREIYAQVAPMALDYERRLLRALSAPDRRALDRLLTRLIRRAEELAHAGG